MKRCSKCGRERKDEEFSASSSTKDGLQCWCRFCKSACPPSPPVRITEPLPTYEKICTKCGESKCGLDFSLKKENDPSYGIQNWCKICMALYKKERRKSKSNSEVIWERHQREQTKQDRFELLKRQPPKP